MHHPIIVGALAAGYVAGAVAWVYYALGGITYPRYGMRVQTVADLFSTLLWFIALPVMAVLLWTDRAK